MNLCRNQNIPHEELSLTMVTSSLSCVGRTSTIETGALASSAMASATESGISIRLVHLSNIMNLGVSSVILEI